MLIDAHVHLPVFAEQGDFEQARKKLLADLEKDQVARLSRVDHRHRALFLARGGLLLRADAQLRQYLL